MLRQFFLFMYMHLESTAILVKVEIYRFVFFRWRNYISSNWLPCWNEEGCLRLSIARLKLCKYNSVPFPPAHLWKVVLFFQWRARYSIDPPCLEYSLKGEFLRNIMVYGRAWETNWVCFLGVCFTASFTLQLAWESHNFISLLCSK